MNTFFTSDTHFDHGLKAKPGGKGIIELAKRPFASLEEMNETMIARWNESVKPGDTVYHLGDFAWHNPKTFRPRLNGDICLIRGNHDPDGNFAWFRWVKDLYEVKVGEQRIVLCHYAFRTWHHDIRGVWHLYGHTHGSLPGYGKSFDIGVDVHDFRPLEFEEVKKLMDAREIGDHPGFRDYKPEVKA